MKIRSILRKFKNLPAVAKVFIVFGFAVGVFSISAVGGAATVIFGSNQTATTTPKSNAVLGASTEKKQPSYLTVRQSSSVTVVLSTIVSQIRAE